MAKANPLRTYRHHAKLTLEQFAAEFGVNKSTVMRWEEGHVPAERVLPVCDFTGMAPHELRPDLYPKPARLPDPTPASARS